MEMKKAIFNAILILFLLLATPRSSLGKLDLLNMDSGVYDIDYRGPETHTYIPSPNGSKGRHSFHHQSMLTHRKFKGSRASKPGGSGKKIQG